ncbi:6-phosphogluconolactonase [Methylocella sp.]|uniref:6-phosphogluconolactonase n=1 Tax=Methylocella sp. TaxID=1978226 RepID=UPI003783A674
MRPEPILDVAEDAADLAARAAAFIAAAAAASKRPFALCLSGGSTPRDVYARLAAPPLAEALDWGKVHLFWGDERFVPADDPKSNFRMAREALIDHVPIPAGNVHPVDVCAPDPETAARRYERDLFGFHGAQGRDDPDRPLFGVTLLGLGTDGHTASLFPGSPALDVKDRLAAAVVGAMPEPRVTLTFRALAASAETAFLVSGASKQEMLRRLLEGDDRLPAARIAPQGTLRIFADRAAFPL